VPLLSQRLRRRSAAVSWRLRRLDADERGQERRRSRPRRRDGDSGCPPAPRHARRRRANDSEAGSRGGSVHASPRRRRRRQLRAGADERLSLPMARCRRGAAGAFAAAGSTPAIAVGLRRRLRRLDVSDRCRSGGHDACDRGRLGAGNRALAILSNHPGMK
jgi:hypothetical protein